ncbi:hypothetical protein KGF57_003603 [Candida theae]|uniref:ER membrane protein complex subunit 7 beta-sandwich domain-containing protein n=1 Tax=Candida theae TaxID=1198502 RepID=A0AAD5BDE0_9ASCO|nr:uncharacterized protein KGF57_003603 [Candida theae]KAI5955471.1 hypothetical protein KGF57_003603 [Candida theae]
MHYASVFIAFACFLNTITAIGFTGAFTNIPDDVPELAKELQQPIPNLNNYPSRIKVDLYKLDDKRKSHDFVPRVAIVDKNYRFTFKNLKDGEYELIANSYDFTFTKNKFKVVVDEGKVVVYDSPLGQEPSNQSLPMEVSHQAPLEIEFKEVKQFYEKPGGSVYDMLLNSPLGFIFRNKTYTVIFVIVLVISLAPTIAEWVDPEFAAQFKEVQTQVATQRLEKPDAIEQQPPAIPFGAGAGAATATATGARKGGVATKKRR